MPKKKAASVKPKRSAHARSRNKRGTKKGSRWALLAVVCLALVGVVYAVMQWDAESNEYEAIEEDVATVCVRVEQNYGRTIDSCAKVLNLPAAYFKALACLECSGRLDMPKRFERHIFKRLKNVRDGQATNYEGVTTAMLHDANNEALKNLATSWGPFQIMGYKCLHLSINVADLRGDKAVYWGMKWVQGEYARLLTKGRYRDAFHYHNAGRVYPDNKKPQTYDPNYVQNGLDYMQQFSRQENE